MILKFAVFALFLLGAPIIFVAFLFSGYSLPVAVAVGLLASAGYLLLGEMAFRLVYQWRCGKQPERYERIPFDKMHMEPHPFLPFVYKRNLPAFSNGRGKDLTFSLHKGEFQKKEVGINNLGLINGPDGKRDVIIPKPENRFRVLCLGDSTTLTAIVKDGELYSYPMLLEAALQAMYPDRDIEVVNCGVGGWSSAETLVYFMLHLVDTEPDVVVYYGAYNDLAPALIPGFRSDYSHCKRNLSAVYDRFRIRGALPDLPSSMYNYFLNLLVPGSLTHTVLLQTTPGEPDLTSEFKGLDTFRRNVEHLIAICKSRGIEMVCSTYCQYLYPGVQNSPKHLKFKEGLDLYNAALREVAAKEGVHLVDAAGRMPADERYYLDSIHLTPDGMRELAAMVAEKIHPGNANR